MLEGDEVTLKTLREEEQEKRKLETLGPAREAAVEDHTIPHEGDDEEELLDDGEIERASDDLVDEDDEEDEDKLLPMKRDRLVRGRG
jgi:hypothetical protein